jgi:hypothetical protein
MIDRPPSKKRLPIDKSRLSLADQQAFERVAALLQKPLSELYEENPHNTSLGARAEEPCLAGDVVYTNPQSWSMPTTPWESSNRWQQDIDCGEIDNFVPHPNRPWTRPSGIVLEEESHTDIAFNQWTDQINQTQAMQMKGGEDTGSSDILNPAELRRSASWSHEATSDEPWVGVPTDFLTQASFHDGMVDNVEVEMIPEGTGGQKPAKSPAIPTQSTRSASNASGPRQDQDTMDQTPSRRSPSVRSDSLNSTENEPSFGLDWEKLDIPQVSGSGGQVISSATMTQSDWTLLEKPHDNFEKTFLLDNSDSKSIKWVSEDSNLKELPSQKPQRRGPFMDQQLREETSSTRKLKACVRCRMQKIRVSIRRSTVLNTKFDQYSAKSTPTTQTVFARHARPSRSRKSTRFRAFDTSSPSARFIVLEKLQDWNLPFGGQ